VAVQKKGHWTLSKKVHYIYGGLIEIIGQIFFEDMNGKRIQCIDPRHPHPHPHPHLH
jgi:hypothetical protein